MAAKNTKTPATTGKTTVIPAQSVKPSTVKRDLANAHKSFGNSQRKISEIITNAVQSDDMAGFESWKEFFDFALMTTTDADGNATRNVLIMPDARGKIVGALYGKTDADTERKVASITGIPQKTVNRLRRALDPSVEDTTAPKTDSKATVTKSDLADTVEEQNAEIERLRAELESKSGEVVPVAYAPSTPADMAAALKAMDADTLFELSKLVKAALAEKM